MQLLFLRVLISFFSVIFSFIYPFFLRYCSFHVLLSAFKFCFPLSLRDFVPFSLLLYVRILPLSILFSIFLVQLCFPRVFASFSSLFHRFPIFLFTLIFYFFSYTLLYSFVFYFLFSFRLLFYYTITFSFVCQVSLLFFLFFTFLFDVVPLFFTFIQLSVTVRVIILLFLFHFFFCTISFSII